MMIPYKKKPFLRAVIKSIDQECMLYKYKEHNFMSQILTREALDVNTENIDSKLVFLHFAMSCSSKLDALLEFIFVNTFTFTDLINAFQDDELYKGYLNDLPCYNNYAARSKWIDTNVHHKCSLNVTSSIILKNNAITKFKK